ncbi:MAG: succinylglutamate desuccinylase/aspartoacylase family protein [Pseudomonadota bacterium]
MIIRSSCPIDFETDGKQVDFIRIPRSDDVSSAGSFLIPIACIRNGSGPTLLFTGGNHGDEFEGPLVLGNLLRELQPEQISGRVIIMPYMNAPAVAKGTRCSPIDGKNLNRIFPGNEAGTITQTIASYIARELIPLVDAVYDLHAGGRSRKLIPSIMTHYLADKDLEQRTFEAALAFGAPVTIKIEEHDTNGMFDEAVENAGKIFCCAELGGAQTVSTETLRIAREGVYNALRYFDLIEGDPHPAGWHRWNGVRSIQLPDESYFSYAMHDGLYEPLYDLGDEISPGDGLGRVHFTQEPERSPVMIRAKQAGILFSRHSFGLVKAGDDVAAVAKVL